MNFPPEETEDLIEALRDELQEYGALLHLLKDQQHRLISRQAEEVLSLSGSIEAQLPIVDRVRQRRYKELTVLAGGITTSKEEILGIRLSDLLPFFPATVAPMISGLVDEINRLVSTVARFAHQNQLLLVRAVESTQAALRSVQPSVAQRTYAPTGRLQTNLSPEYASGAFCMA